MPTFAILLNPIMIHTYFLNLYSKSILMGMQFLFSILTFFLLSFSTLFAQNTQRIIIEQTRAAIVSFEKPMNAIVIKAKIEAFSQLRLGYGDVILQPFIDDHVEPVDSLYQSNLIFFDEAKSEIQLSGLKHSVPVELILIHVPPFENATSELSIRNDCEMPDMISQEIWRAGLPAPDYERIKTEIKNIILHHSATSNNITDYYGLVRSFYISHTQVNGWSDIGYNYLIAPDGTIFAGRDPGLMMEQDEVMGAHFCASNNGTLGICMIGTFMNALPTEEALLSLNKLLVWKTAKDSLSPYEVNPHPLNPQLSVISGHRDGCATLCPGDSLYKHIHPVREACNHGLENCGVYLFENENNASIMPTLFPNPTNIDNFQICSAEIQGESKILISDIEGRMVYSSVYKSDHQCIDINHVLPQGLYFVHLITNKQYFVFKLIRSL